MIEVAPKTQKIMTYAEAVMYCQFCNHNGHTDWRLPNTDERDEIATIYCPDLIIGYWFNIDPAKRTKNIALQNTPVLSLYVIPVRDI